MSRLLVGVIDTNSFIFVGFSLLVAAVTFFSSYFPAHRATRVDPMIALRYE
jgi:ABC-type antimicrobial peptide transport system permease subunit